RRQESGREGRGRFGQGGRDRGRQGCARASGIAGVETEDARERRQERRQESGRQGQGSFRQHRRDRGRQGAAQASGIAGAKTKAARERRQERSQESGRQRQGNSRQRRRDRGRQGSAQASGIAGAKTEDARERQERGRQGQGKFRQHRQGLARGGELEPAGRSRANGELNHRRRFLRRQEAIAINRLLLQSAEDTIWYAIRIHSTRGRSNVEPANRLRRGPVAVVSRDARGRRQQHGHHGRLAEHADRACPRLGRRGV